jgi:hypothetical protein
MGRLDKGSQSRRRNAVRCCVLVGYPGVFVLDLWCFFSFGRYICMVGQDCIWTGVAMGLHSTWS